MAASLHGSMSLERPCRPASSSGSTRTRRHYDRARPEPQCRRGPNDQRMTRCHSPRRSYSGHYASPSNGLVGPSVDPALHDSILMERTPSGNSILSRPTDALVSTATLPMPQEQDMAACARVESAFRRRPAHSTHERILRKLIRRDEPLDSGFALDDAALDSILTATDTLFFDGALAGRVQWEWSSDPRYHTDLIGTTALRRCQGRDGFETLVVLSAPVLRDERYDRRLLLSVFLHELIHCYLFITCGFEARMHGGHTAGFYRIAALIDAWVGPRYLSICKLRENPERFCKLPPSVQVTEEQTHDRRWDTYLHEGTDSQRNSIHLVRATLQPTHDQAPPRPYWLNDDANY
ncbi:unnamed protein product [Blumeria hordei]|uniref:SprT-like domain-containing protein n=1 Tax=Blumeria hordei TaxID=2867405 RepID=A0A383UPY0_BLUHO|nr:unnamed protein product [Blumeria hordei]